MTQLETESTTIDGHKFTVHKLDPFVAQDILIDLGQLIAPALGKAVSGAASVLGHAKGQSMLDLDTEDPKLADGIAALALGLDKAKMRQLVQIMAEVTIHNDGQRLSQVMAVIFRGDLPLMYRWLGFALKVNFSNFYVWAASAIKRAIAMALAAQSRDTSKDTGQL